MKRLFSALLVLCLLAACGAARADETQSIYEFSTGCIPVFSGFYTDENLETLKAIEKGGC